MFSYGVYDAEGYVGAATTYEGALEIIESFAEVLVGKVEIVFEEGADLREF